MSITKKEVLEALKRVRYPGFARDIVACGVVTGLQVGDAKAAFTLEVADATPAVSAQIEREARRALESLAGLDGVDIRVAGKADPLNVVSSRPSAAQGGSVDSRLIPEVRHTIAVASGKGGVGKSTIAVNLAVALARRGAAVGLLEVDIYGPSIPLMMGLAGEQPTLDPESKRLIPFERYGVRFMSLGFLVDPDSAVIWRGPMVMKAIEQ